MDRDVINRFRPLSKTREEIKAKADKLHEVAEAWNEATAEMLFRAIAEWDRDTDCPAVTIPTGYDELTYLLAWWCDQSPYSIDPSPLTDCLQLADRAAGFCHVEDSLSAQDAFNDLGRAAGRVSGVCNRMIYAMIVAEGRDPPPPSKETHITAIEKMFIQGMSNKQVYEQVESWGVTAANVRQIKARMNKKDA